MKINKAHTLFDERLNIINEVITKYIEKAIKELNEMEELDRVVVQRFTKNIITDSGGEVLCVGLIAAEYDNYVMEYLDNLPQTFEKPAPKEIAETNDISAYNSLEETNEQPLDGSFFVVRDYRENLK